MEQHPRITYEEAWELIQQTQRVDPTLNASTLHGIWHRAAREGNWEMAVLVQNELAKKFPTNIEIGERLVYALTRLRRHEDAREARNRLRSIYEDGVRRHSEKPRNTFVHQGDLFERLNGGEEIDLLAYPKTVLVQTLQMARDRCATAIELQCLRAIVRIDFERYQYSQRELEKCEERLQKPAETNPVVEDYIVTEPPAPVMPEPSLPFSEYIESAIQEISRLPSGGNKLVTVREIFDPQQKQRLAESFARYTKFLEQRVPAGYGRFWKCVRMVGKQLSRGNVDLVVLNELKSYIPKDRV